MNEKKKIITKMSDEIVKFYFNKNAEDIYININKEKDSFTLTTSAKINVNDEEMEDVISNFKYNTKAEYEYMWELVGEYSDENELELLFILSKDIKIYYENEILKFIIKL